MVAGHNLAGSVSVVTWGRRLIGQLDLCPGKSSRKQQGRAFNACRRKATHLIGNERLRPFDL